MAGTMIPYKSSNEMILSVMQGQTAMTIADGPPTVPQVKAGKVKGLAVTGKERAEELPDVPSMVDAGYPDVDVQLWSGICAPIATPPAIVAKLEKAFERSHRRSGRCRQAQGLGGQSGRRNASRVQAHHRKRHRQIRRRGQSRESEVRGLAPQSAAPPAGIASDRRRCGPSIATQEQRLDLVGRVRRAVDAGQHCRALLRAGRGMRAPRAPPAPQRASPRSTRRSATRGRRQFLHRRGDI